MNDEFNASGRIWFRNALSYQAVTRIEQASTNAAQATSRRAADLVHILENTPDLQSILATFGPNPQPTRVVSFNKSETKNWATPWHQDRVITRNAKNDNPRYKNWTCKNGQWHCEPPLSVLEDMAFVRIHLDDTSQDQGPMEIALGSQRLGKVPSGECKSEAERLPMETCIAERGDVLVLKMLTLHRSIAATNSLSRRTIRADYAFAT